MQKNNAPNYLGLTVFGEKGKEAGNRRYGTEEVSNRRYTGKTV
jgi:hypothetical protein